MPAKFLLRGLLASQNTLRSIAAGATGATMKLLAPYFALGMMVGCIALWLLAGCNTCWRPPGIPGYHWSCDITGCELYDESGKECASFVTGSPFYSPAQACTYNTTPSTCEYFETNRDALNYIRSTEMNP
jgi:hypothetical protein